MPDLWAMTVRDLYRVRLDSHTSGDDVYRGRSLVKFPEDLRTYQRIIEQAQPKVIVEVGSFLGGSALWFADQLRNLCGGGRVISVDVKRVPPVRDPDVTFITGDATRSSVVERVRALVGGEPCMVVEDSAHTFEVTSVVLAEYAPMVSLGQWLVVEDGIVDDEVLRRDWMPRGVVPAIDGFLKSELGGSFQQYWLNDYLVTCHPGGWLRRVA